MTKNTTPTNEAEHGLPEVAAAREVIRAYFAGELDDTMILNLSESLALSRGVPETGSWIAADDVYRHARTIDVALNGEDGAASRPALCDVVAQIASLARQHGPLADALAAPAAAGAQGEGVAEKPCKVCGTPEYAWANQEDVACLSCHADATPQPAAADGGVRERARKIITNTIGFEFGQSDLQEVGDHDMENLADAIAEALSSHRQAGDGSLNATATQPSAEEIRDAAAAFLEAADARDNEETSTQYPEHERRLRQYKAARADLESLLALVEKGAGS